MFPFWSYATKMPSCYFGTMNNGVNLTSLANSPFVAESLSLRTNIRYLGLSGMKGSTMQQRSAGKAFSSSRIGHNVSVPIMCTLTHATRCVTRTLTARVSRIKNVLWIMNVFIWLIKRMQRKKTPNECHSVSYALIENWCQNFRK